MDCADLSSLPSPSPSPSLSLSLPSRVQPVIVHQASLARETLCLQGTQKVVHIVAKNLPFVIDVEANIDLRRTQLYAELLYDAPRNSPSSFRNVSEYKLVDTLKMEPMSHKIFLADRGERATVEIRIRVLTSQHEDSLFRIKIGVLDPAEGIPVEIVSQPIRCVSKPSQVSKCLDKNRPSHHTLEKSKQLGRASKSSSPERTSNESAQPPPPTTTTTVKKRSNEEAMLEVLDRMEKQQQQQQTVLYSLINNLVGNPQRERTPTATASASAGIDFEAAFETFLQAYHQLSPEERPRKIQKVFQNSTERNMEAMLQISHSCLAAAPSDLCSFDSLPPFLPTTPSSFDEVGADFCSEFSEWNTFYTPPDAL